MHGNLVFPSLKIVGVERPAANRRDTEQRKHILAQMQTGDLFRRVATGKARAPCLRGAHFFERPSLLPHVEKISG